MRRRVVITGMGVVTPLGDNVERLYRALMAVTNVTATLTDVVVADVNPHRLELARRLGATAVVEVPRMPLEGLDPTVLLECSGHPTAVAAAVSVVAPGGRSVLVGMGADTVSLPMPVLQEREITVTGTFRYANTWPAAIALVARGRVDLDALVTGHYGLADAAAAMTALASDPHSVKSVVHPSIPGEPSWRP